VYDQRSESCRVDQENTTPRFVEGSLCAECFQTLSFWLQVFYEYVGKKSKNSSNEGGGI